MIARRTAALTLVFVTEVLLLCPGATGEAIARAGSAQPGVAENAASVAPANRIWYRKPAKEWTAALPLGNGRMGAMVFGSVPVEKLQLNEESLWAGQRTDVYPDGFAQNLKRVQQLVLDGKIAEARKLGVETLTQSPTSYRSFEPLGALSIAMKHAPDVKDYHRQLDLATGLARVTYRVGDATMQREIFISAVDDVLVLRLSASKPAAVSATIRLSRPKDMTVTAVGNDRLHMDGQIIDIPAPQARDDNPGGSGPGGAHMKFAGRLLVRLDGGTVTPDDETLVIDAADEAVVLFTAATDFSLDGLTFDRTIEPGRLADGILAKASAKPYARLLADHVAEHASYFDRVSLDLGRSDQDRLPTDERLAAMRDGKDDPGLIALYFQFGRYLLMSSSRAPGRLPTNLQGVWSRRMWAPWEADYHLNINLQMNYWPADPCNLYETIDPLANWFARVAQNGRVSARKLYGADGWVAFTTTNLFGRTTPGGSTKGSQFVNGVLDPLAGAWMAMTLWRHYEFTGDRAFLDQTAYPVVKGAAQFLLDYLVEDREGHLVIVPSTSPENSYVHPETGRSVRITYASTYHSTIVRAVFEATVAGSRILDRDPQLRARLQAALTRLPRTKIGKDGTIQEWIEDFQESSPGHRHMSHLIGLHPFSSITPEDGPLFEAARKTIERRLSHGGGHTGWSRAWIVNCYARLLDGDTAYRHVVLLLQKSTLPNLFDTHPPFQIDGNFGGTAGIAEMLLQSHAGTVHLMPAVPRAWPAGSVKGLRARGGFIVGFSWNDGKVTACEIQATQDGRLRLRIGDRIVERAMKQGDVLRR